MESLGEQFRAINSAFLIDYSGLKVVDATELRRKIREIDGHYVVVKNTLALRAVKDTRLEPLGPHFQGPTAIAYHPKDVIALGQAAERGHESQSARPVQGRAGRGQGGAAVRDADARLSAVAGGDARANWCSCSKAPLQRLATVLKAPVRDLALVLKQVPK